MKILTSFIATHSDISTWFRSTARFRTASKPNQRSPTALELLCSSTRSFGVKLESRSLSAQNCSTSELLRTL